MPKMTAGEIHGERVFNHLLHRGATTKAGLCAALGLTPPQVEAGLRNIREVVADREANPIVCNPDHTYELAQSEKVALRYIRARTAVLHRWTANLQTSTIAPAAKKFASPALGLVNHQVGQVASSLDYAEQMVAP